MNGVLPAIEANERRPDAVFEFVDGSFALVDYESAYREADMITYGEYLLRLSERFTKDGTPFSSIRMVVIYTADVRREQVKTTLDRGGYVIRITPAFLSELDSESIRARLTRKVKNGEMLSDEELMEFIILPLSYRSKEKKQEILVETVDLAEQIGDSGTATFVLSGLMVFSDKIVDEKTREKVRRAIQMTQVEKIIREDEAQKFEKLLAEKDKELREKDDKLREKDDKLREKDDELKTGKAEFLVTAVEKVAQNSQVPFEDACRIIGISTEDYASASFFLRQRRHTPLSA